MKAEWKALRKKMELFLNKSVTWGKKKDRAELIWGGEDIIFIPPFSSFQQYFQGAIERMDWMELLEKQGYYLSGHFS